MMEIKKEREIELERLDLLQKCKFAELTERNHKKWVAVDDLNKKIQEIEDSIKNHLKEYCEDYQFGCFDTINKLKAIIKHYSGKTEKVNK
jgi:hypothetical protein